MAFFDGGETIVVAATAAVIKRQTRGLRRIVVVMNLPIGARAAIGVERANVRRWFAAASFPAFRFRCKLILVAAAPGVIESLAALVFSVKIPFLDGRRAGAFFFILLANLMLERFEFTTCVLAESFGGETILIAVAARVTESGASARGGVEIPRIDRFPTRSSSYGQMTDNIAIGGDAFVFAIVGGLEVVLIAFAAAVSEFVASIGVFVEEPSWEIAFARPRSCRL